MDTLVAAPRVDSLERKRFEGFKLGKPAPLNLGAGQKNGHGRSHSRNNSSSFSSFSFPSAPLPAKSTSVNDMSQFSLPLSVNNGQTANTRPVSLPPPANPAPASKRNSHHRRRSSVSTRHESAELMGVSLPDLPPSTSDDNINLGEKDSIRRRALWALEGKPDVAFSKVEIPDITTPDVEKMMFDFSTKPSLSASSSSSFGSGLNLLGSKRDSFKLLASSSSSKDQLGTLLEEEEEEEDCAEAEDSLPSPAPSMKENVPPNTPLSPMPAVAVTQPTPAKARPANLNLRPLSLTPENLITVTSSSSLPTPTLTPSPRSGLRSLSLTPSPAPSEEPSSGESFKQSRRSSLVSPTPPPKRPVLNLTTSQLDNSFGSSSGDEDSFRASRRSSISYKRTSSNGSVTFNVAGLPTPEMTPTFGRRYSNTESISGLSTRSADAPPAEDDQFFPGPPTTQTRPLSASEQHFLFKSHNALLARITDLERALSFRRRESSGAYSNASRPLSVSSNVSSSASDFGEAASGNAGSDGPSDEMLRLIADLKAERDELKRDVDGWRQRVNNLENQTGVLAKRLENERRDAWVARSRVGLLEVEKGVLVKKLEAVDELLVLQEKEREDWEKERMEMKVEVEAYKRTVEDLEQELQIVKSELKNEREQHVHLATKAEIDPLATPTPNRSFENISRPFSAAAAAASAAPFGKKHGLGLYSVDSESSATDVEPDSSDDGQPAFGASLKAVEEEEDYEQDGAYDSEEDNGLAGYEDEEDTDNVSVMSSSSFDSEEDLRSVAHLQQQVPRASSPTTPTPGAVFSAPRPTHVSRASLSRTWTFPKGPALVSAPKQEEANDTPDLFFACLGEVDSEGTDSMPSSPSAYSYEKSKGIFARGFSFAPEDDNASFFLPFGAGVPSIVEEDVEKDEKRLSIVAEEEEEEEEVEELLQSDDEDVNEFGNMGGIQITFTPPQEEVSVAAQKQIQVSPTKRTSPPPMLPALDFGGEEDQEDPFNFGRPLVEEQKPLPALPPRSREPVVAAPSVVAPPPPSSSAAPQSTSPSSPSMIPRVAPPSSIPRVTSPITPPKVLPSRAIAPSSNLPPLSFVTPPTKRGGTVSSFIPQPVTSPSPLRSAPALPPKARVPTSTFIRQPSRKPLLPSINTKVQNASGSINGSTMIPQPAVILPLDSRMNVEPSHRSSQPTVFHRPITNDERSSSQMKSVDLSYDHTTYQHHPPTSSQTFNTVSYSSSALPSVSSVMSSPLSARLSFQTFTNFIPWGSRPTTAAPSTPASAPAMLQRPVETVQLPAPTKESRGREGFVSREKQLQRLRARMDVEGVAAMKSCVNVHCKKCAGELVFI